MARPSSRSLVDRLLGGRLQEELTERRAAGDSYAVIARWFSADHDFDITPETVRQWCMSLGIEKAEPEGRAS